jgi:hypothetical protein
VHRTIDAQAGREVIRALQPNKRFVDLKEINALLFVRRSRDAASITGVAFPIEGSWSAY